MRIDAETYASLPDHLKALFVKAPNPGSEEVVGLFPVTSPSPAKVTRPVHRRHDPTNWERKTGGAGLEEIAGYDDTGSAARFYYCAKASKAERGAANNHPTVKPLALMQYLCRLVTPKGGVVLDPFAGSGTTGVAADREGFNATLVERDEGYAEIARARLTKDGGLFAEVADA